MKTNDKKVGAIVPDKATYLISLSKYRSTVWSGLSGHWNRQRFQQLHSASAAFIHALPQVIISFAYAQMQP